MRGSNGCGCEAARRLADIGDPRAVPVLGEAVLSRAGAGVAREAVPNLARRLGPRPR